MHKCCMCNELASRRCIRCQRLFCILHGNFRDGQCQECRDHAVEVDEDALRDALEEILEILVEAQSTLPPDGLYIDDMLQFYRSKVRRIAAMADAALSREEAEP